MEFIAILFLILFWVFITAMILYYYDLLKMKDEYKKKELIGFDQIFPAILKKIIGEDNQVIAYGVLVGSGILAWLTTLFGGLFNEIHSGSYFFHSSFFMIALFFGYTPLKEIIFEKVSSGIVPEILKKEKAFFYGFGIMLTAANFAAWGVHSDYPENISFFWALINGLVCIILVIVKMIQVDLRPPEEIKPESDVSSELSPDENTQSDE